VVFLGVRTRTDFVGYRYEADFPNSPKRQLFNGNIV
jgi:hypothetical protein